MPPSASGGHAEGDPSGAATAERIGATTASPTPHGEAAGSGHLERTGWGWTRHAGEAGPDPGALRAPAADGNGSSVDAALAESAPEGTVETRATSTARPSAASHPATHFVALHLSRATANRLSQMTLQLQPAELGRVEVRLKFGTDGQVQAMILAERPETLELMQRDARALERAIQAAGLGTEADGLSFGLMSRDPRDGQPGHHQPGGTRFAAAAGRSPDAADTREIPLVASTDGRLTPGRIDIRV